MSLFTHGLDTYIPVRFKKIQERRGVLVLKSMFLSIGFNAPIIFIRL